MQTEMSSWSDIVNDTTAIQIAKLSHSSLIVLNTTTTIKQCLETLASKNILSAPVIDETNRFLGFVDVLDIAGYVLLSQTKSASNYGYTAQEDINNFFNSSVKEVINFSKVDYPVFALESGPLKDILDSMSGLERSFHPHRVALLSSSQTVTNLVTQMDVIRYAAKNYDAIRRTVWGTKTLRELNITHKPIEVRIDDYFTDALRKLYSNRISGLALVDHEGRLSANLSASDLRGITSSSFDYFTGSTIQFLCKGTSVASPMSPVSCSPDTTFCDAIKILAEKKVHRLYIVNEANRPEGVITLSDMIQILRLT